MCKIPQEYIKNYNPEHNSWIDTGLNIVEKHVVELLPDDNYSYECGYHSCWGICYVATDKVNKLKILLFEPSENFKNKYYINSFRQQYGNTAESAVIKVIKYDNEYGKSCAKIWTIMQGFMNGLDKKYGKCDAIPYPCKNKCYDNNNYCKGIKV